MWAPDPGRRELRPEGEDHQHPQREYPIDEEVEDLARGGIAPVHVLPYHQHRLTRRKSLDLRQLGVKRLLLALLWSEVQGRIAVAGRDREQVRQQGDGLTEIIGPLRQHSLKLGQALLLRILTSKAGCALKLSYARIQGAVLVMGRAEIPQSGMWLA